MKRNFNLCPPTLATVELFERSRDVNGNPTAHYMIFWDNGLTGADWAGGHYRTKRRAQVGYRDKCTGGAIGLLQENIFPGTEWTLVPDSLKEGRHGGATFQLARDPDRDSVPVIFRAEKSGDFKGDVTAVFPTIPADRAGHDVQIYAHVGQHGGASRGWYRETRPATDAESAPLRRELESAPFRYNLKPVKRWTDTHDAIRLEALREQEARTRAKRQNGEAGA